MQVEGCLQLPAFGLPGNNLAIRCGEHAEPGMELVEKSCTAGGCSSHAAFGWPGGKPEVCKKHASIGMLDVKSKRCNFGGFRTVFAEVFEASTRVLSFVVSGLRTRVLLLWLARLVSLSSPNKRSFPSMNLALRCCLFAGKNVCWSVFLNVLGTAFVHL